MDFKYLSRKRRRSLNIMTERKFEKGQHVQHFKRETLPQKDEMYTYEIIGEAVDSETKEKLMVYRALYGDHELYVRPYEMFMSEVDHKKYPNIKQKYRFELIEK